MAIEKKMDCVILGLLSHENLTCYEIKKEWLTLPVEKDEIRFAGICIISAAPVLSHMYRPD